MLTDALLKHLCVAHGGSRNRDFEEVWPLLRNTMYAGESALIHCLSGRHRAGIGGCVFRALLAQESWDVAVAYVKSCRRSLDIPGIIHEEGMRWTRLSGPVPSGTRSQSPAATLRRFVPRSTWSSTTARPSAPTSNQPSVQSAW